MKSAPKPAKWCTWTWEIYTTTVFLRRSWHQQWLSDSYFIWSSLLQSNPSKSPRFMWQLIENIFSQREVIIKGFIIQLLLKINGKTPFWILRWKWSDPMSVATVRYLRYLRGLEEFPLKQEKLSKRQCVRQQNEKKKESLKRNLHFSIISIMRMDLKIPTQPVVCRLVACRLVAYIYYQRVVNYTFSLVSQPGLAVYWEVSPWDLESHLAQEWLPLFTSSNTWSYDR